MEGVGNRGSGIGNRALALPSSFPDARFPIPAAKAAQEFEAVFIAQMLAPLFASVETPAIASGGKSEQFLKSLLQENFAKAIAARGGFGLADQVRSALLDIQGASAMPAQTETR